MVNKLYRFVSAMVTSLLVVTLVNTPAAQAVVTACDGTSTQNSLTVTAQHGTVVYVDTASRSNLDGAYLSYKVTDSSGAARSNLWMTATNFTGGSVTLSSPLDSQQQVATVSANGSSVVYYLVKASAVTLTDQLHDIKVYNARPDLGGTVIYSCTFTFTEVRDTIKASANKVQSVTLSSSAPDLGSILTVTAIGKTGTVGSGQSPDNDIIWITPSGLGSWPTRALRLESVQLTVDVDADFATLTDQSTFTDTLILWKANSSKFGSAQKQLTSGSSYKAEYNFRVIGPGPAAVTVQPIAQISSGTQIKHTDLSGSWPTLNLSGIATPLSVTKTAQVVATPTKSGYNPVEYTVTASTTATGTMSLDEIIDEPSASALPITGSATVTDTTRTSTAISDAYKDGTGKYHFTGPFTFTTARTAVIKYKMWVPNDSNSYSNIAYGVIGDKKVGSNSTTVSGQSVTGPTVAPVTQNWPATVATGPPTNVAITTATINGVVSPLGNYTTYGFQWGTASNLAGATCVEVGQNNGSTDLATLRNLTGLTQGTTYYYRIVANYNASSYPATACTSPTLLGVIYSFTTLPQGATSQTITFAQPANVTNGSSTVTLNATASSGLPVTMTSTTPSICTIATQPDDTGAFTVNILGPGDCTLTASQEGNATYAAATDVTRTFTITSVNLTVTIVGSGNVTSDKGGVNCNSSCVKAVQTNSLITLTATPSANYVFTGWSGSGCSGTGTCAVTMSTAKSVTATFTQNAYTVTVTLVGTGSVSDGTTTCSVSPCSFTVATGSSITLTETPGTGYNFSAWSASTGGVCTGSGTTCTFTNVTADKVVTATFVIKTYTVTVSLVGTGSVSDGSTSCSSSPCTFTVNHGSNITLTATAGTGYNFTGWSASTGGVCTGTGTCTFSNITENKVSTATFTIKSYTVTVTLAGTGSVSDGSTSCSSSPCVFNVNHGSNITLTATAGTNYSFTGWSASTGSVCTGTGTCTFSNVTGNKAVTATFTTDDWIVTVTLVGTGSVTDGTTTCSVSPCQFAVVAGDSITLTETPGTQWNFTGWSASTGGVCTGNGTTCTFTNVTGNKAVTATFTIKTYTVTVSLVGTGSVTDGTTSCSSSPCVYTVNAGSDLTLTATAGTGYTFTGWSASSGGVCTGTGTCTFSNITENKVSTATFTVKSYTVTVTLVGTGSVSDGTTSCSTSPCVFNVNHGSSLTLTATGGTNYSFTGWSASTGGVCTGTGTCTFSNVTGNKAATATFITDDWLVTVYLVGTGSVTDGTTTCSVSPCQFAVVAGDSITITETPGTNWNFSNWSASSGGACTGSGTTCTFTNVTANKSVTATFTIKKFTVTVNLVGTGSVSDGSTSCSTSPCVFTVDAGSNLTLTATPGTNYSFVGWGGNCSGASTCALTNITSNKAATATFSIDQYTVTVTLVGTGSVSDGTNSCASSPCVFTVDAGTNITLTELPGTGYNFSGWSASSGGVCTGTGSTCTFSNITSNKAVTATFGIKSYTVTVTLVGSGSVSDGSTSCSTSPCVFTVTHGSTVTLTATAGTGFNFTGWSASTGSVCTGSGTCTFTSVAGSKVVTATFTTKTYTVTVTLVGNGSVSDGTTTCSSTPCVFTVNHGSNLTLNASAAVNNSFTGWSASTGGVCTGTGACTFSNITENKVSTATFAAVTRKVTVTIVGSGSVSDGLFTCSTSPCVFTVNNGDSELFTATAGSHYTFTAWSGSGCSGNGICSLANITSDKAITATFSPIMRRVNVTVVGTGTISNGVTSCAGPTCTFDVIDGSDLTLTATPGSSFNFAGWSGACTGQSTCTLYNITSNKAVTATFAELNWQVTVTIVGEGSVTDGVNTCTYFDVTCTFTIADGVNLVYNATPNSSWTFAGWADDCTGTGTCALTMTEDHSIRAVFVGNFDLFVAVVGTGNVSNGINSTVCSSDCSISGTKNLIISLAQTPAAGWRFVGWTGACTGSGGCLVTMDKAKSVTATFVPITYTVTLTIIGSGSVTDGTTTCTSSCTFTYNAGQSALLLATAATNNSFTGWSGDCLAAGTCALNNIQSNKAVTATFTQITRTVTVTIVGTGTVTYPGGTCSTSPCYISVVNGSDLTLEATPGLDFQFTGWSVSCSGSGACTLFNIRSNKTVTATFTTISRTLTVTVVGTGSVSDGTKSCASTDPQPCTFTYANGATPTWTATAGAGWTLAGWAKACGGTGNCLLTMDANKAIAAVFVQTVDLYMIVDGSGSITNDYDPATCSTNCAVTVAGGVDVLLTATPASGWQFVGWSGACSGSGTCTVSMTQAQAVTATFRRVTYTVTLTIVGKGSVTDGTTACSSSCTFTVNAGSGLTLVPTAATGYSFTGWSTDCSGTGNCVLSNIQANKAVRATFTTVTHIVTVTIIGDGTVTDGVTACSISPCEYTVDDGADLWLTATPDALFQFDGWTVECTGTSSCGILNVTADKNVTATFSHIVRKLTVLITGTGTASDGSSTCSSGTCVFEYEDGDTVALTAAAGTGWRFAGWTRDCSGTSGCALTMSANRTVKAVFISSFSLYVAIVGSGTVSNNVNATVCSTDCAITATQNASVLLPPTPAPGWRFTGWTGACTGTGTCGVTLDSAKTVTATFVKITYTLTVRLVGNGTVKYGNLTCSSSPCVYTVNQGDDLLLIPAPGTHMTLSAWSGDCTGNTNCSLLTVSSNKTVTATFVTLTHIVTLTVIGSGTASKAGIPCAVSPCTYTVNDGVDLTLTALASLHFEFSGWSQDCGGTGSCLLLNITDDKAITATFTQITHTITVTLVGTGTVSDGTTTCSVSPCTFTVNDGDPVTLTPSPGTNFNFGGWSGACSGTTSCTLNNVVEDKVATANFQKGQYRVTVTIVGSGTVSDGITSCNTSPCVFYVASGSNITLTRTPGTNFQFSSWTGACTGTGSCVISNVTSNKSVTATFIPIQWVVTVTVVGLGTVTDGTLVCGGPTCSFPVNQGSSLSLTKTPGSNYYFQGWTGSCIGTTTCTLANIGSNKSVTATFLQLTRQVTITIIGQGSVTDNTNTCDAGSSPCVFNVVNGADMNLFKTPATHYEFTGWTQSCAGTGSCALLKVTSNRAVTATFTKIRRTITVTLDGPGSVTDGKTTCSTSPCVFIVDDGDPFPLVTTPGANRGPGALSGECTGTAKCTVPSVDADGNITVSFPAIMRKVVVTLVGPGTVTDGKTTCGTTPCTFLVPNTGSITLTATAAIHYAFTGWTKDCTGNKLCTITNITADKAVTAKFVKLYRKVTVTIVGDGSVTNGTKACTTSPCVYTVEDGADLSLLGVPGIGSELVSWTGACTGSADCDLTNITVNKTVTLTFQIIKHKVTVTIVGSGTVSDGTNTCSTSPCVWEYAEGTSVNFSQTPGTYATFTGWNGSCAGVAGCALPQIMTDHAITANFSRKQVTLTVTIVGSGVVKLGTTTCSVSPCTFTVNQGDSVTLVPFSNPGFVFKAWAGACTGTSNCVQETIMTSKAMQATFERPTRTVKVTIVGTGIVTVGSKSCNVGTCEFKVPDGSDISLAAYQGVKFVFSGWSGNCTSFNDCAFPAISTDKAVTATFTPVGYKLTVTIVGKGTVTGPGKNCTTSCVYNISDGDSVSLTAAAAANGSFTGWTGDCTGVAACAIANMTANKAVTATFTDKQYTVTIYFAGPGKVQVGSKVCTTSPCTVGVSSGENVAVTAIPDTGAKLSGWSGACSGTTNSCVISNVKANVAATAAFQAGTSGGDTDTVPANAVLLGTVYFDSSKYNLKTSEKLTLQNVLSLLKAMGYKNVYLVGHTDSQGGTKNASTLSNQRNEAVKTYLKARITGLTYYKSAKGLSDPKADNTTAAGRALNRRVEVYATK